MQFEDLKRTYRNAGLRGIGTDIWCRGAHRICRYLDMHVLILSPETLNPSLIAAELDLRHGFLDKRTLQEFADTPGMELSARFIAKALAKGDMCYSVWVDNQIACYCWFAANMTPVTDDELLLSFDPAWHYEYKIFVLPDFRGRRLSGMAAAHAFSALMAAGTNGLISLVAVNNHPSLKSLFGVGFRPIGRFRAAKLGGRWFTRVSKGCSPYGIRVFPAQAGTCA